MSVNAVVVDSEKTTLFDEVGGLGTLRKVHKVFYDKVYAHPWLKHFFVGHNQQAIEDRQTSFMAQKMGGDVEYWGKEPKMAHRQMYITQELFDVRHQLLKQSLAEVGVPKALSKRWLKIDYAFRRKVVKDSIESFYRETWKYEKRIIVPKSLCRDLEE
jgi:hemoglobin